MRKTGNFEIKYRKTGDITGDKKVETRIVVKGKEDQHKCKTYSPVSDPEPSSVD